MTTTISPDWYCDNLPDSANSPGITEQTKKYWSNYCELRQKIQNQPMPSHKSLRQGGVDALEGMFNSLFTPQGMEFMSGLYGTKILYSSVKKAVGRFIENGLSKEAREVAINFIKNGGDEAVANAGAIASDIKSGIAFVNIDVATEAGYDATSTVLAGLFEVFDAIAGILEAAMIVQMIGMIFDSWDPCDLNNQLDANALHSFSQSFNDQFRMTILQNISTMNDSYGRTIINGEWPVEYFADQTVLQQYKQKEYKKISTQLVLEYLNNLRFNSCGQPIPKVRAGTGRLISNDTINSFEKDSLIFFSDNNTVVSNWLYKWWPIFLGLFIVLIVLFVVIKKRQT